MQEIHQNMLALLALVEQGRDSPSEKGEILRELGRFDEAIVALTGFDGAYKEQADLIVGFLRSGDAVVREIWCSEYSY